MKSFFVFCSLLFIYAVSTNANNNIYEQRRTAYIDNALAHLSTDGLVLQAYRGLPVDSAKLAQLMSGILVNGDADFQIVQAVRILYLTNGAYDSTILRSLNQIKYWINFHDTAHVYWSENHMVMWMSSDWLLHEKYGKPVDSYLHDRLVHFLQIKNQYGYYEFFSSVYNPYCLSGLLNLADFSQDTQIKSLATTAAQKLLSEYLLRLTNDKGVYFPIAGRNYYGKYESAYGQNHNNLIYLLTGMGVAPASTSHAGAFLASSTLAVDSISASWVPNLDTTYFIGHTLDSGFAINAAQRPLDRTVFQWSSGAYFTPQLAVETGTLLTDSSLWKNYSFSEFSALQNIALSSLGTLAESFSSISKSSVICGEQVVIFKHGSVTLSSVSDFWKGKVGYQQFPCVANVGTTAVFTASGVVKKDWTTRSSSIGNDNLPYVSQKKNIALLMYRPEPKTPLFGVPHPDVAIHWKDADFDEMSTDSMWLIGRQDHGYVALRRYTIDEIDSVRACHYTTDGQAYVIVVGDSAMYGSYNQFKAAVHSAQFDEQRYYDSADQQSVYYAKIVMDSITVDYAWGKDSLLTSIANIQENGPSFTIYPNPANDLVRLDFSFLGNQPTSFTIINSTGQIVYKQEVMTNSNTEVHTANWPKGLYLIVAENKGQRVTKKVLITE